MVVLLTTLKLVTAFAPTFTSVAPVKFVPVIVTAVFPDIVPYTGEILVTVGAGKYVYNWFGRLVPSAATTTTLALPAVPAAVVATICVGVAVPDIVAGMPPTVTADAPANPVPVSVNTVPPASDPVAGVTLEMYNGFVTRLSLALVTYQLAPLLENLAESPRIIITLLTTLVEFSFTIDGETAPDALAMFFTQSCVPFATAGSGSAKFQLAVPAPWILYRFDSGFASCQLTPVRLCGNTGPQYGACPAPPDTMYWPAAPALPEIVSAVLPLSVKLAWLITTFAMCVVSAGVPIAIWLLAAPFGNWDP